MADELSITDVFQLVGRSLDPYFVRYNVELQDDEDKKTRMPLIDFIIRAIAEELAERWVNAEDVKTVLEKGDYDTENVVPTGVMGGLVSITRGGGRRRRRTARR